MWTNAVASMVWPTFAWVAGPWPSVDGAGVTVALEIGPLSRPSPLFTFADYSLTLTEVNPR